MSETETTTMTLLFSNKCEKKKNKEKRQMVVQLLLFAEWLWLCSLILMFFCFLFLFWRTHVWDGNLLNIIIFITHQEILPDFLPDYGMDRVRQPSSNLFCEPANPNMYDHLNLNSLSAPAQRQCVFFFWQWKIDYYH